MARAKKKTSKPLEKQLWSTAQCCHSNKPREGENMDSGGSKIILCQTAVEPLEESELLFFADVADILKAGRATAYRAVNVAMVETYWHMGQRIVEEEQQGKTRAGYGEALMARLSRYLGENFGKEF